MEQCLKHGFNCIGLYSVQCVVHICNGNAIQKCYVSSIGENVWNVIDMQSIQLCGITLPENASIMLNGQSHWIHNRVDFVVNLLACKNNIHSKCLCFHTQNHLFDWLECFEYVNCTPMQCQKETSSCHPTSYCPAIFRTNAIEFRPCGNMGKQAQNWIGKFYFRNNRLCKHQITLYMMSSASIAKENMQILFSK